ncbi:MAG: hypothetical protein ACFB10_14435 [Salibacteraceae bacterium]
MLFRKISSLVLLLAVGVGLFSTTGCRKGENDPFFSLRSRKARLTGDWTVQESILTNNDTTYTYDGTNLTVTVGGAEIFQPYPVTYTWKFENDGKYEMVETRTFPDGFFGQGTLGYVETVTTNGIWNFAGGDDDYRNGERLLLLPDQIQTTRSNSGSNIVAENIEGQINGVVYDIDQLRNTEMDWKYSQTVSTVAGTEMQTGEIALKKD